MCQYCSNSCYSWQELSQERESLNSCLTGYDDIIPPDEREAIAWLRQQLRDDPGKQMLGLLNGIGELPMVWAWASERAATSLRRSGRQQVRLGRVLRKGGFSDETIGRTLDSIKGYAGYEPDAFEVVYGRDILTAYSQNFGSGSCMSGQQAFDLLTLYGDNPDRVGLVKCQTASGAQARALLWQTDQNIQVLDRIYSGENRLYRMMAQWAKLNGIWYRASLESRETSGWMTPKGQLDGHEDQVRDLTVTLNWPSNDLFPYMDTFVWCQEHKSGTDCRVGMSPKGHCDELTSTEGGPFACHEAHHCEACEEPIHGDDALHGPNGEGPYCEDCYCERYGSCDECGDETHRTNLHMVESEEFCTYCRENHTFECTDCGEVYHERQENEHEGDLYCEHCVPVS